MTANLAASLIPTAIARFLARHHVTEVRFAQGALPPPEMAYLVNFPRVAVTLAGCDEIEMETDGAVQTVILPRGAGVVIPPNCWDRPSWTRKGLVLNLVFGRKQVGLALVDHDGRAFRAPVAQKMPLHLAPGDPIHDMLRALLRSEDRSSAAPAQLQALLHSVSALLQAPPPSRIRKAATSYESICLYLQANFAFPLTRESVAEHFNLSPNHVSRLFQREGMIGFSEYLNRVRIDRAKYLLRNHPLALDAVADKCGYRDAAYFCRVFKRFTKLTPTVYRERNPRLTAAT